MAARRRPIPSEIELAARFSVSQGTVRKAIDELAAENLLVRRQGKGTFVATHAEAQTQYRFLRLTPDAGAPAALQRRLLDCRRLRAPADVARLLALKAGEAAVQVRRLLLLPATRPVVLDDLWLPGTAFKGLTMERLAGLARADVPAVRSRVRGAHDPRRGEDPRRGRRRPRRRRCSAWPSGAPLLSVERLSYTYGDRPVELRRGLYHTASHHYRNELS